MKSKSLRSQKRYKRWQHLTSQDVPPHWWPQDETWPPVAGSMKRASKKLFPRALFAMFFALILGSTLCAASIFLARTLIDGLSGSRGLAFLGLGLLLLVFIGVASFAGLNIRRVFEPLDALLEASQRVAEGDTDIQVPERGVHEVRTLTRAFNQMVRELNVDREERRDLLADVTHELRTPLTVIQGEIEGMIDQVYPRDDAHLQELLLETQRMSAVVEDLRTLSLADHGALQIRKELTDLIQLVSETLANFRAQADANGVELTLKSADPSITMYIDPLRMRQVISNLLTNAMRYTVKGDHILVCIEPLGTERTIIEVFDSGAGIQPDELSHIFDRFYKSVDSTGSGLGLAIAKKLVEAHEGLIDVESEFGSWTRFRIELPTQHGV
jgi:two-component system sensor histidine kinase BaeS